MKKKFIFLFVICITITTIWYYMCHPVKLNVELISKYSIHELESISHWKTICVEDDSLLSNLEDVGINISNIDFRKNNIILSYEKEIESITYKRITYFQHSLKENVFLGKAKYGDSNQDVLYIYRIKKVNVIYDIFSDVI